MNSPLQNFSSIESPPAPVVEPPSASITWSWRTVLLTLALFLLAGLAEIGGGYLVWGWVRAMKPWWWALLGSAVLVSYGFIPTLQPSEATFARVYAVYGGVFIVLSYGWGWAVDGQRPDVGDCVGASIALVGVLLAWFWPR
jgi:small multidrug resistance family-3 protein